MVRHSMIGTVNLLSVNKIWLKLYSWFVCYFISKHLSTIVHYFISKHLGAIDNVLKEIIRLCSNIDNSFHCMLSTCLFSFIILFLLEFQVHHNGVLLMFSVTFALSCTMFVLIIFEIIGLMDSRSVCRTPGLDCIII